MFQVLQKDGSIFLSSSTSKITIFPQQGAILNSWQVDHHGKPIEIIDGYQDVDDFRENGEVKGFRSCKLSPYVCRTENGRYRYRGEEYMIGKFFLNGSSLHGLLYNVAFNVVAMSQNEHSCQVTLHHSYKSTDRGFPFFYDMEIEYVLAAHNRLSVYTTVKNTGIDIFPIADGWHPYFKLAQNIDQLQLKLFSNQQVVLNEGLVPTGDFIEYNSFTTPSYLSGINFDHCFVASPAQDSKVAEIMSPDTGAQISIYSLANYPYVQLYTPAHRQSIAIEVLSALPNAFNNHIGLIELPPGEAIPFACAYSFNSL